MIRFLTRSLTGANNDAQKTIHQKKSNRQTKNETNKESINQTSNQANTQRLKQTIQENKPSNNWKEETSISIMQLFSENTWLDFFKTAGFVNIESWCFGKEGEWNGTLIITGIK